MSVRGRWIIVGLAALALTSAAAGAPNVLRRFDSFTVERVEISGTRYLAPHDALKQSGITKRSNVFDDFATWRSRLRKHPMILDATIERHLPATIRVSITETQPIALARTPALVPVDARARALPIDPAAVDLDVPLLAMQSRANARGVFADRATRSVITLLDAVQQRDERMFSWISEAGVLPDHGVRLDLRNPAGAQALVPADPESLRLNELQIALADLALRGELANLKRIDARFHDQIVVTLKNGN